MTKNKRVKTHKVILTLLIMLIIFKIIFFIIDNRIIMGKIINNNINDNERIKVSKEISSYNIIELIKNLASNEEEIVTFAKKTKLKYVLDSEKVCVDVNIQNYQKGTTYTIVYGTNNRLYEENIKQNKMIEIFLDKEGKNECYVAVKKDGQNIDGAEWKFTEYYIKSYNKQFLDEKEKNGMGVHLIGTSTEKFIPIYKALGSQYIRVDLRLNWIYKNNKFIYDIYDETVKTFINNGIKILAILGSPGNYLGTDKIVSNYEELEFFNTYVESVSNHYPEIMDYEIWNEPNAEYKTNEQIEWYKKTVNSTSKVLKNKNINIGILTGSTSYGGSAIYPTKFIDKISETYKYTDSFSAHPYDFSKDGILNNDYKKKIKENINTINSIGGFVKNSNTEFGGSTYIESLTEEEQANKIVQQYIIGDKYGIDFSMVYNFRNSGNNNNEKEDNFGLVTASDYTPKKSYYATKNYYQNTNGAEYIGQVNIANGIEAHVYDKDGKPKIIAWATDTNKPVTIDYAGFEASDLYGKEIENTNGKLEITTSPVYIDNVSTKNFYQAISNSITTGYKEFDEKFANEINKVPELKTKISNLNTFAESLKNVNTLDENIANSKMKEHFSLGNTIIKAYDDGRLDIEYVKLSSILDYLNTIGNAYEDLITVSAKTRITDLTSITNEVNEAKSIIENDTDIDIVYPNKIYKFSKDLLDTSSYVLGLDEENDIKTGLINSKATHAKYLADWSEEFSKIYIKGWLQGKVNSIKDENSKVYSKNEQLKSNTKISTKYNSLIENLNNLPSQTTSITKDTINSIYNQQYELINTIVDEFNNKKINISESEYQTLVTELLNISEQYKELFNTYITEDDIENSTIENNINNVIDRYNENKDIDMTMCAELINNIKEIYNDKIQTEETSYNYLNKRRIQSTCTIISKMLENKIKETAQQEAQKIGIAYNIDQSTLTNKEVIAQIKLPNSKSSIESNPNNEKYTFTENGTKNITINIRGYKYNYNIKVTNIDKTPPQITGIEQGGKYKESITPQITDENLSEVKLIKDGQEVENYKQNTAITQEGIYQLKATDKAGNETSINFVIAYPEDEKYKIENNTIKNIKGETSVETLKGKLQVDEKYTIKRKDTEIQNSENIATGDILETESGNKYTLIVRGDLNKDGKVDIKDLVKMRKFLLLGNNLDESEEMAADTNIDGKEISIKDLVKLRIILLTQ